MLNARDIRRELKDCQKQGLNLYISLLHPPNSGCRVFRVGGARTRQDITQVRLLSYGPYIWRTVEDGDVIYAN